MNPPPPIAFALPAEYRIARFSPRRIGAMVLRHLFLMRGSWTRIAELVYWPMINVLMWGFFSRFFVNHSDYVARAAGVLIGAVLLWDVLFRSNLGLSISFLEEVWSRNLGHLAVSPLTSVELAASLLTMSLIRTLCGMLPAAIGALLLYQFNIFALGLPLLAFFVNLMVTGWAFGLAVSALVLRYGQGAESLAWVVIVAIAPFCGIYYPISVLPHWLGPLIWALPPSHVFEGMRAVMFDGTFSTHELAITVALNLVYLAIGVALFVRVNYIARVRGLFIGMGE
jgi:ABC-2 type transport system permease protein